MTKLDDLAGRAAAQLRGAVDNHLAVQPGAEPRDPVLRRAVVLAVLLTVLLAAALLVDAGRDATSLRTADQPDSGGSAAKRGQHEGTPKATGRDGSTATADGAGRSAVGSGTQSATPTSLPGQAPPPADAGNEPPSSEVWPAACGSSINTYDVSDYPAWCVEGYTDAPTPEGHPLNAVICRDTRAGDGVLHFRLRQEADFLITDRQGREVWRWSKTRTAVVHRHERRVRAGGCVQWVVIWDERDQAGRKMPQGAYRVAVTVLSDEVKGQWSAANDARAGGYGTTTTTG